MSRKKPVLIFTCEHGGNHIPEEYRHLFLSDAALSALSSHRGIDWGALDLAKKIKDSFSCPLFFTEVSRLLIDCNRSIKHPKLFSEFSKSLKIQEKEQVKNRFYLPYRNKVQNYIQNIIEQGHPILHISFHSFTPDLNNKVRDADIGILYDPARRGEKMYAMILRHHFLQNMPALKVRLNYPYKGTSDGLTSDLRKEWPDRLYCGIELEVNQKLIFQNNSQFVALTYVMTKSLEFL